MWPYLGPPWTDSHQIWAVDFFHHAHGIQNAEMQKKVLCNVIASVLYWNSALSFLVGFTHVIIKIESWMYAHKKKTTKKENLTKFKNLIITL